MKEIQPPPKTKKFLLSHTATKGEKNKQMVEKRGSGKATQHRYTFIYMDIIVSMASKRSRSVIKGHIRKAFQLAKCVLMVSPMTAMICNMIAALH